MALLYPPLAFLMVLLQLALAPTSYNTSIQCPQVVLVYVQLVRWLADFALAQVVALADGAADPLAVPAGEPPVHIALARMRTQLGRASSARDQQQGTAQCRRVARTSPQLSAFSVAYIAVAACTAPRSSARARRPAPQPPRGWATSTARDGDKTHGRGGPP